MRRLSFTQRSAYKEVKKLLAGDNSDNPDNTDGSKQGMCRTPGSLIDNIIESSLVFK